MGKIIDFRKFYDHPAINLKEALDEIEKLDEYMIFEKKELEQICKKHPDMDYCDDGEFLNFCCMCDTEFDSSDKIFMIKSPTLMKKPKYVHTFFHEDCFKYYFKHKDDDIDQATIDSYESPKNICGMCEDEFEENLKWTDGGGYYCDKCGPFIAGLYPISIKEDKPTS